MDVQMMDGLACRRTDIDADIVTVRIMVLITDFLGTGDQLPQVNKLVIIDVEVTGKVAMWYNKEMARAGRMEIICCEAILTLGDNASTRL